MIVIVADDAPAAEACIVNPVALGMRKNKNKVWFPQIQLRVVSLCCTVSRRANDTWWQRYTIDVNPDPIDVNPDDGVQTPGTVQLH